MKKFNDNRVLFFGATLAAGLLALVLRVIMLLMGFDDKGLLKRMNPANILLWVVAVGYLVFLLVILRKLGGNGRYRDNFGKCSVKGCLAMGGGGLMLVWLLVGVSQRSALELVLGILACAGMIFTGFCRWKGRHPNFLFHGIVCLFFVLELTGNYRGWSADPQLQDYGFQLLAGVALMLASFQRACCDANLIDRRKVAFACMAACFFCLVSLSDPEIPVYYAAAGLWAAGSMCSVRPLPEEEEAAAENEKKNGESSPE